jgi:hypothetical protein
LVRESAREVIAGVNDRAADTYEPLAVIARLAGHRWYSRLVIAATALTAASNNELYGARMLIDVLRFFIETGHATVFSRNLVAALKGEGGRTASAAFQGKPLNETVLASLLRPYGILSANLRQGTAVGKGYRMSDFKDVLHRYVPKLDIETMMEESRRLDDLHREAKDEQERQAAEQQSETLATRSALKKVQIVKFLAKGGAIADKVLDTIAAEAQLQQQDDTASHGGGNNG